MTNEEKATELGIKYARQYHHNTYPELSDNSGLVTSKEEIKEACMYMAQWKEHQFSEEKKQLLKRAGDWWELMLRQGSPDLQRGIELIIEQFKKEMMEE